MLRVQRLAQLSVVVLAATAQVASSAQICSVPGSHATIGSAVLDGSCSTIQLSAGTYTEAITIGRGLTLAGPGVGKAVIAGSGSNRQASRSYSGTSICARAAPRRRWLYSLPRK